MKRAHEPGESQEDQLENEKRARENDEARKQGKTYVEHGGKHDGSMKSSLFQHVMDVTEDMFKIPEVYGFKKKSETKNTAWVTRDMESQMKNSHGFMGI